MNPIPNSTNNLEIQSILKSLTCPVTLEPLTSAVHLTPCGHKINFSVAEKIFGPMNGNLSMKYNPCPLCRKKVSAYFSDREMSQLAEKIFNAYDNNPLFWQFMMYPSMKLISPRPYPGCVGKFLHSTGDWTYADTGLSVTQFLSFINTISDAFITKFELFGYKNGSVKILISFKKESDGSHEFFEAYGVSLDKSDLFFGTFISESIDELQNIFTIIARYNVLPATHFLQLCKIIEKGKL